MNKLLLIDGNSILNRAFYGLPELTNSEGIHTNALLGFLNITQKVIEDIKATHVCVAFDVKHPTFRHERYKEYKGTRKPMPEELREQLPLIKELLLSMNIKTIERPGYEADDILGTLSRRGYKEGFSVVLLSGDRDLLQLATDDILVMIPKTKGGKTTVEEYYAKDVVATYGVDPVTFIDMKGLMGDTSDNIPGIEGIGEKTAAKLLIEYGSLDGIYEHIGEMKANKQREKLENGKELAYLSRELATIKLDCELDIDLSDCVYGDIYNPDSYELFKKFEFKSYLSKFKGDMRKITDIQLDINVIDDMTEYYDFIAGISGKHIGVSFILSLDDVICVSFCNEENGAYIVPIQNFITIDMVCSDILSLKKKGVEICMLNVKEALSYFDAANALDYDNTFFDNGLAMYLLAPLKEKYEYYEIASEILGQKLSDKNELLGKNEITLINLYEDNIKKYIAYNSYVAYMSKELLVERLKAEGMLKLYEEIEIPCMYSLYTMEKNGIILEKEALILYGEKLKKRIDELTEEIYGFAGKSFNINSTKQLGEVLFEDLGLKAGKKTKTGYSTSVEVLEKLSNEHPVIPLILEYRQLSKLNSTYVEGLSAYIREDGRIHGKFNQTVTATGRISSTEPNLQNIPTRYPLGKEIRKLFVPEKGFVFIDADYSQIELRVLAHMSNDELLIDAYNKDSDIHSITASEVFGVPMNEVDSTMRRKAKAVNFGIVYGISSFGLGQDLDISRKEAEGYIQKYFDTYTGVKEYLDSAVSNAYKNGYSESLFGRRRPIPELKSSNYMTRSFGERVAMNSPIQGTAADIMKIAMINVNKALIKGGYRSKLVLQIHDELIIEAPLEEKDEVMRLLENEMVNACSLSVPLIVEAHCGNSWYEAGK